MDDPLSVQYVPDKDDLVITRARHEERLRSVARSVAFLVILLGLILRMRQYIAIRSLWLDEALLALNISDRTFVELSQPLDYDQGAPVGFLFAQKLVLEVLGNEDYVLRLVPLGAGIISLYLIYKVADHYTTGTAILTTLALFAVSGRLVYYASEAKQYSSDVAVCLLLLLVAAKCFDSDADRKHYIALGVIGSLALWFSHPALFIVTGIGLSLALHQLARKDWRRLSWLGIVFLLWLVSFVALYVVSLRSLAANDALVGYWAGGFMPMPPWRDAAWFPDAFFNMLRDPAGLSAASIGLLALLVGCLSLFARKWQFGIALILPIPMVLLASGLRKYPFSGRLLLFLAPIALLLIGEGMEKIRLILLKPKHRVALGLWLIPTAVLLYTPTAQALQNLWHPQMGEHIKPVMSYVGQHRMDEDSIYVYYGAEFAFRYYASQHGFGEEDYVVGIDSRQDVDKYTRELNGLIDSGRIWFVFSHVYDWDEIDERAFFLDHLDKLGTRLDEFRAPGASAHLYDLRTQGP